MSHRNDPDDADTTTEPTAPAAPEVTCAECGKQWPVKYLREGVTYVCATHVQDAAGASKPGFEGRAAMARAMSALAKKHDTASVSLCRPGPGDPDGT